MELERGSHDHKQMLGVRDSDGTLRLSYSMERMREQFNKQHLLEATA